MSDLIYSVIASLDGYIEDDDGSFEWAEPDAEVHALANDLLRPIGTYLYGRRMYETMAVWETDPSFAAESALLRDFADTWQSADKVVYSTTLDAVCTARTRLERDFDPAAVREMKVSSDRDLVVSGPNLAAHALRAGLVDELQLFVVPVVVGGGKPWLPDGVRLDLELAGERRFDGGTIFLRYRVAG